MEAYDTPTTPGLYKRSCASDCHLVLCNDPEAETLPDKNPAWRFLEPTDSTFHKLEAQAVKMAIKQLTFVTGNAMKLQEVRSILTNAGVQINSKDLDVPELQGTTQEIAREKCRRAAEILQGPCITEDTALCYEALNGLPGPYIKFFLKELGLEGLNTLVAGFPTNAAYALCTFAYSAGPGTEPIIFEGRIDGKIVPPRGPGKFGWNPIFEENSTGKTFAEMTEEEKNVISHRYRALEKLTVYLRTLNESS